MKVLGIVSHNKYLVEVEHIELEKLTGNYAYGKNLKELKVGDEMNLGAGYNFTMDIQSACKAMSDAMKSFEKAQSTMRSFALMVADLPNPTE
jgi:hypothetical protein